MPSSKFDTWLERLDRLVDPEDQRQRLELHLATLRWEQVDRLPLVLNCPVEGDWPHIPLRAAYEDPRLMLLRELGPVYASRQVGDDRLFMVRANYGVGILSSMFGLSPVFTDDDAFPWFAPLDSREAVQELVNRGLPAIPSALGARVLETEQFFQQTLARFDHLGQAVSLCHCDLQGPFCLAEQIWGSDIYLAMYDCPELVHALLDLITEAYLRMMALDKASIGEGKDVCRQWGLLCRGGVVIREDSATLISPDAYRAFVAPYTARILQAWGGVVHFCGQGQHLIDVIRELTGLTGFNFGNSENYDLLSLYHGFQVQGLNVVGWGLPLTPAQRQECRTGITLNPSPDGHLSLTVPDIATAREIWQGYIDHTH
jgi:hypothetical protein